MSASIEARILAFVEADLLERVAPALKAHFESKDALVQWKRKDEFGQPLLLRLVETGDEQIIDLIIKHVASADVASVVDDNNANALHYAVLSGSEVIVKAVLEHCKELNQGKDSAGCLPVHWASKHGKTAILSEIGASPSLLDVEDQTPSKWTPLHYAASSNKVDTVKWLLSHGADKSKKDGFGRIALDIAQEHSYFGIIDLLQ